MLQPNKRLVVVTVDVEREREEEIEDSDETYISDSSVLTVSTNDGPETGILTDVERFGYRIYFDFV